MDRHLTFPNPLSKRSRPRFFNAGFTRNFAMKKRELRSAPAVNHVRRPFIDYKRYQQNSASSRRGKSKRRFCLPNRIGFDLINGV